MGHQDSFLARLPGSEVQLVSGIGKERFYCTTTPVVEKSPPHFEVDPFKIPMGIIDSVMSNRYAGDGTVHPGYHLLYIKELCELFKIAGMPREVIMRKLFSISLKDKAMDWYMLLDNSHLMDWKELMSLFYSKFYPLHEIHQDRNYIYTFGHVKEKASLKLGGG